MEKKLELLDALKRKLEQLFGRMSFARTVGED